MRLLQRLEFLVLIYINDLFLYFYDLTHGLSSNAKLFANYTSLFSVIHDVDISADELKNVLYQINKKAFQWKMSFNPGPRKQAQ